MDSSTKEHSGTSATLRALFDWGGKKDTSSRAGEAARHLLLQKLRVAQAYANTHQDRVVILKDWMLQAADYASRGDGAPLSSPEFWHLLLLVLNNCSGHSLPQTFLHPFNKALEHLRLHPHQWDTDTVQTLVKCLRLLNPCTSGSRSAKVVLLFSPKLDAVLSHVVEHCRLLELDTPENIDIQALHTLSISGLQLTCSFLEENSNRRKVFEGVCSMVLSPLSVACHAVSRAGHHVLLDKLTRVLQVSLFHQQVVQDFKASYVYQKGKHMAEVIRNKSGRWTAAQEEEGEEIPDVDSGAPPKKRPKPLAGSQSSGSASSERSVISYHRVLFNALEELLMSEQQPLEVFLDLLRTLFRLFVSSQRIKRSSVLWSGKRTHAMVQGHGSEASREQEFSFFHEVACAMLDPCSACSAPRSRRVAALAVLLQEVNRLQVYHIQEDSSGQRTAFLRVCLNFALEHMEDDSLPDWASDPILLVAANILELNHAILLPNADALLRWALFQRTASGATKGGRTFSRTLFGVFSKLRMLPDLLSLLMSAIVQQDSIMRYQDSLVFVPEFYTSLLDAVDRLPSGQVVPCLASVTSSLELDFFPLCQESVSMSEDRLRMALCIVQGVLHKIPVSEGLAAPVMEALATMKSKFLGPSLALIHSVSSPFEFPALDSVLHLLVAVQSLESLCVETLSALHEEAAATCRQESLIRYEDFLTRQGFQEGIVSLVEAVLPQGKEIPAYVGVAFATLRTLLQALQLVHCARVDLQLSQWDISEAPSMDNFSDRISFLVSQIEMIMDTVCSSCCSWNGAPPLQSLDVECSPTVAFLFEVLSMGTVLRQYWTVSLQTLISEQIVHALAPESGTSQCQCLLDLLSHNFTPGSGADIENEMVRILTAESMRCANLVISSEASSRSLGWKLSAQVATFRRQVLPSHVGACDGDHTFLERPTLATSLADYITNLLEIVMSPLSAQESDVDYFCNVLQEITDLFTQYPSATLKAVHENLQPPRLQRLCTHCWNVTALDPSASNVDSCYAMIRSITCHLLQDASRGRKSLRHQLLEEELESVGSWICREAESKGLELKLAVRCCASMVDGVAHSLSLNLSSLPSCVESFLARTEAASVSLLPTVLADPANAIPVQEEFRTAVLQLCTALYTVIQRRKLAGSSGGSVLMGKMGMLLRWCLEELALVDPSAQWFHVGCELAGRLCCVLSTLGSECSAQLWSISLAGTVRLYRRSLLCRRDMACGGLEDGLLAIMTMSRPKAPQDILDLCQSLLLGNDLSAPVGRDNLLFAVVFLKMAVKVWRRSSLRFLKRNLHHILSTLSELLSEAVNQPASEFFPTLFERCVQVLVQLCKIPVELYLDPVEAGTLLELLEVSFEYGGTISTSSALLTRKTFVRLGVHPTVILSSCRALTTVVRHHLNAVSNAMPVVSHMLQNLLRGVFPSASGSFPVSAEEHLSCIDALVRVFRELTTVEATSVKSGGGSNSKQQPGSLDWLRVYSPQLLHTAVSGWEHSSLSKEAKRRLSLGLFCLLDVCSDSSLQQLYLQFTALARQIFKSLHSSYKKEHVYNPSKA